MAQRTGLMASEKSMLEWALYFASIGWFVFPLKTDAGKALKEPHSMTTEGRSAKEGGHNAASRDPAVIRDWWRRSPNSGIGLNFLKSGMVLVDIDPRKNGDKTLAQLRKDHPGKFESSIEGATGGGGTHLFYFAEPDMRYPGTLGQGIDVKHNGYGILAPSPHPDGVPYAWVDGKTPDDGEITMPTLSAEFAHKIREASRAGSRRAARKDDTIGEEAPEDDPFGEIDDRALGMTEEQIRKIVFDVPNEGHEITDDVEEYRKAGARSYDDWFKVMCGIYHETGGSEDGRAICLEWSEQSAVHLIEKFDKSWASADAKSKGFRPVTFKSVIEMSNLATKEEREAKYEDIRTQFVEATTLDEVTSAAEAARQLPLTNKLQRDALGAEYRTAVKRITNSASITMAQAKKDIAYVDPTLTNVPEWCRNICYVMDENEFYDTTDSRNHWTKMAFDITFARAAMTEEDIRTGVSKPTHMPSDLVMTRYNAHKVAALGYAPWVKDWRSNPYFEMDGREYLNTYSGRNAVPAAKKRVRDLEWEEREAIETFKRLLKVMFPHDEHMMCSWLKYVVHERRRVGWSPLLYSVEGIGKTLLFDLITMMVGSENVSLINGSTLGAQFNKWAEGKLLAFVEEVGGYDKKDRFDALNALKPVITNNKISIRKMRHDDYAVPNTINVIMTTNKGDAFDLSRGDTRIWIPTPGFRTDDEVVAFKRANPRFYTDVVDAFTGFPGAIRRYLIDRPYHPDFRPGDRAPASAMKQEVIEANKSEEQLLIEDAIKSSNRTDVSNDLLRVDALMDVCSDMDPGTPLPEDRWLAKLLQGMGFTRLGRARPGGSKAPQGRFWSRTPSLFQGASLTARINAYIEEHDTL